MLRIFHILLFCHIVAFLLFINFIVNASGVVKPNLISESSLKYQKDKSSNANKLNRIVRSSKNCIKSKDFISVERFKNLKIESGNFKYLVWLTVDKLELRLAPNTDYCVKKTALGVYGNYGIVFGHFNGFDLVLYDGKPYWVEGPVASRGHIDGYFENSGDFCCDIFTKARNGDGEAQFRLGLWYETGENVSKSFKKALELFKLFAKKGHPSAQLRLGDLYKNGGKVPKDYGVAFEFYRQSAQSHPEARFKLAEMYEKGEGTNKDKVYAHMWYYASERLRVDRFRPALSPKIETYIRLNEDEATSAANL